MKKSKILSIIIATAMITTTNTSIYANDIIFTDDVQSKVTSELQCKIEDSNDSDLISIGIRIKDLDPLLIDRMIEERSDFKVLDYKDIDTYSNGIMKEIIEEAEEKYGFEKSHITALKDPVTNEIIFETDIFLNSDNKLNEFSNDIEARSEMILSRISDDDKKELVNDHLGMSIVTKNISDNIDEYLKVRRDCVIEAYKKYNYDFIDDYISDDSIITNVGFAPYIIAYANKKTIKKIATNKNTMKIDFYSIEEASPDLDNSCSVTGVTSTQGTGYNSNLGYTGMNIGIGIIEAASGKYKSNYSMLSGCSNLQYMISPNCTGVESWHATLVTSIIKGKSTYYNGVNYRGVAPDANVYQTSCEYSFEIPGLIEMLAQNGVSIINYSGSTRSSISYSNEDWLVDQAIDNLGIVFVTSSGNVEQNVQSPANSYNCIAVGNLAVNGSDAPYSVNNSSSYVSSNRANKPDIVAPGTEIFFPYYGSGGSGTSYSSPIVAGIAAQLLQCAPILKLSTDTTDNRTHYNAVKSALLIGADNASISTSGNSPVSAGSCYDLLRDKSGAGLVNSKKSIDILKQNGYSRVLMKIQLNSNGNSEGGTGSYSSYNEGDKIRAVLCYSKIYRDINFDLDLKLYNSNMTQLATSISLLNNVEIIEYEIPEDGNYLIRVEVHSNSNSATSAYLNLLGTDTLPASLLYYVIRAD